MAEYLETIKSEDFNTMIDSLASSHPCRLLYLEDSGAFLSKIKRVLEDEPVIIFSAKQGDEADQILDSEDIDAVIVDIRLGDDREDGQAWLIRNRKRLEDKAVVVLSAHLGDLTERPLISDIALDVVKKGAAEQNEVLELPRDIARAKVIGKLQGFLVTEELLSSQGRLAKIYSQRRQRESEPDVQGEGNPDAPRVPSGLNEAILEVFKRWLDKFSEDETIFLIGKTHYRRKHLVDEVEQGTALGLQILKAFVEDMGELL